MLITETTAGTLLLQSGDDALEITRQEALNLLERLVHNLDLTGPELVRVGDDWTCPHCHQVASELVEVDAGSVRLNSAEVDGDTVYPSEDGGERDFHTMSWLCSNCECPVDVPAELDVVHS